MGTKLLMVTDHSQTADITIMIDGMQAREVTSDHLCRAGSSNLAQFLHLLYTSMGYYQIHKLLCTILIAGELVLISSGQRSDKEVLIELKNFLQNQGAYDGWMEPEASPCDWQGVGCDANGHVRSLDLSSSNISGPVFSNFSRIAGLTHLDLSANSITGELPYDLNICQRLQHLNLSRNLIGGVLDVSNLTNLQTLDVSHNRFEGSIDKTFPVICGELSIFNVSNNNLTGDITGLFESCSKLNYADLNFNRFTGKIWKGIAKLIKFSASENDLTGGIPPSMFPVGCKLQCLDLSSNHLYGHVPSSIANCSSLAYLSLWDNRLNGSIPPEIGSVTGLEILVLGSNRFNREMPSQLINCSKLKYLDVSDNNFGGNVQEIFGKLKSLRNLRLRENNYTGGISTSGILELPQLTVLDLSLNRFSGNLPIEIGGMNNLRHLVLAENNFSGDIPSTYCQLVGLQTLDLSYNNLSGRIPVEIGNLTSLFNLMLAGNQLSGEIPREIGNCTSLLWFNLAGNKLSGHIPHEMVGMGRHPEHTFAMNQRGSGLIDAGTTKCLDVRRFIPTGYPGFTIITSLMKSRKNCYSLWNRLLTGHTILRSMALSFKALGCSGYVQLSHNLLQGEIPPAIGAMGNVNVLLLDCNQLSGSLPTEISQLHLIAFNISNNSISGTIPSEIGSVESLQSLDLSCNNLSGSLPSSLNHLTKLSKFNVSYNPLLSGNFPTTGQLSTLDEQSFLGDPLISLHFFNAPPTSDSNNSQSSSPGTENNSIQEETIVSIVAFFAFFFATFAIREYHNFM